MYLFPRTALLSLTCLCFLAGCGDQHSAAAHPGAAVSGKHAARGDEIPDVEPTLDPAERVEPANAGEPEEKHAEPSPSAADESKDTAAMTRDAERPEGERPEAKQPEAERPKAEHPQPEVRDCAGDVRVHTQADLEQLRGCQRIEGNLWLFTGEIESLEPLQALREVKGTVGIGPSTDEPSEANPQPASYSKLTSLTGLEGLRTVSDGLRLQSLPIADLHPLAGLETGPWLMLDDLDALTDLKGLEKVRWGSVNIERNAALRTLEGLAISESTSIMLRSNPVLRDFSVLQNTPDGAAIHLYQLPGLTSLLPLKGIERLYVLYVGECDGLQDLTGLEELSELSMLNLSGNRQLRTLHGLELTKSPQSITLSQNPLLDSLEGAFGPHVPASLDWLTLEGLPSLDSLAELQGLERVGTLQITELEGLEDLSGLEQLRSISMGMVVKNNAALSSLQALESVTQLACFAVFGNGMLPQGEVDWLEQRIVGHTYFDQTGQRFACLP